MSLFGPEALVLRAVSLALALALDATLGDPPTPLHPVAWLGRLVAAIERALRRLPGLDGVAGGGVLAGLTVAVAVSASSAVSLLAHASGPLAAVIADALLIWLAIAGRSLAAEGRAVGDLLGASDLPGARVRVSRLVARRTDSLDESGVASAAIESLGENVVDGVIAPLLWAAALGAPGAWLHKAASTLDSMVGYRTARYERFGRISARLDDALAWLPARLALAVVPVASTFCRLDATSSRRVGLADRLNHASPNSAHGEAVFAGALNVSLGGAVLYADGVRERPTIGADFAAPSAADVGRAAGLVMPTAAVTVAIACAALLLTAALR